MMLFYLDIGITLQLFRPWLYAPPCSSHNVFLLQPVLTLFVQSSVIHCIIVSFGQELNIPIFPADRVLVSKLPSNWYITEHIKFKKRKPTNFKWQFNTMSDIQEKKVDVEIKKMSISCHTFRGPLVLCVLLGSPCLLFWRPQSRRLWWDPLPDWSKTADLLCGKLAPYCHCNDMYR